MKKILFNTVFIFFTATSAIKAQAPANDDCHNAIDVSTGCSTPHSASTIGATASPFPAPCSSDADDDIWYTFTATSTSVTISVTNAVQETLGTADIGVQLFNGICYDFGSVFCDSAFAHGDGQVTISGLFVGSKYSVRFWSTGTGTGATFDFCVQDLTVVPVKISHYSSSCLKGIASISWTTTEAINSQSFIVEKSKDAKHFESIGLLNTAPESVHHYSFTDMQPNNGKTFYRLKQIDKDGATQYFPVLTAECSRNYASVYPNPVTDQLYIQLKSNLLAKQIKIYNSAGVLVKTIVNNLSQDGTIAIKTADLKKGIYLVYVSDANGNILTAKFLKN